MFGPGTIGSLTWLSRNEAALARDTRRPGARTAGRSRPADLQAQPPRRHDDRSDRASTCCRGSRSGADLCDFEPYGYDERQFCSPGFDLPVGRLTRSPNGDYPEYHTSADDLALISRMRLAESMRALAQPDRRVLDEQPALRESEPKGEPRLGKRGLYGSRGGGIAPGEFEHALLWVLSLSDGAHDLLAIAQRSGLRLRRAGSRARCGAARRAGCSSTIERTASPEAGDAS